MEVHAHTHTARKKWTHYFWEFFMLFLAVLLGFFVENQREHYIEHKREVEYIPFHDRRFERRYRFLQQGHRDNLVANEKIDTLITIAAKERKETASLRRSIIWPGPFLY